MKILIEKADYIGTTKKIAGKIIENKSEDFLITSSRFPFSSESKCNTIKSVLEMTSTRCGEYKYMNESFHFRKKSFLSGSLDIYKSSKLIFSLNRYTIIHKIGYERICSLNITSGVEIINFSFVLETLSNQQFINRSNSFVGKCQKKITLGDYPVNLFYALFAWNIVNRLYT